MKVLLSSFLKNGHTAWFDPQTEIIGPQFIAKHATPFCGFPQNVFIEWAHITGGLYVDINMMEKKSCLRVPLLFRIHKV